MLKQDVSYFDHKDRSAGSLASKLVQGPSNIQELIGMNVALIVIVAASLAGNIMLAIASGWKLALVVIFGSLPFIFGAGYLRIRLEMRFQDNTARLFSESARFATEAVGAIRTVKALTMEQYILENYSQRLQSILKTALKSTQLTMLFYSLAESIEYLGMALAFW